MVLKQHGYYISARYILICLRLGTYVPAFRCTPEYAWFFYNNDCFKPTTYFSIWCM